ncbi:MAG: alpha/beta fold hydrolase [Alphaproteobacteria bacterium]|nr:alpha/beta fold hydrolase [Alphaproteobacteria bacterium]
MTDTPPLLLIPGLLCDASLWVHQSRFLADVADVQVVETIKDETLGDIVTRALADAPPQFALAGLSMGGYIAFEFMRRVPERITRLALLDTSARADDEDTLQRRRGFIELAEQGKFKGVTPRLLPAFVHPDRLTDTPLVDAVTRMTENVGKDAFLRQQRAIMARPDSRPNLSEIAVPTVVICGRQDAATPLELSIEIADGIPGARLCIIEECGHLSTMERPHAVTALMRDWLLG